MNLALAVVLPATYLIITPPTRIKTLFFYIICVTSVVSVYVANETFCSNAYPAHIICSIGVKNRV